MESAVTPRVGTSPAVPRRRTRFPNLAERLGGAVVAIRSDGRIGRSNPLWEPSCRSHDPLYAMGKGYRPLSHQTGRRRISDQLRVGNIGRSAACVRAPNEPRCCGWIIAPRRALLSLHRGAGTDWLS